MATGFDFSGACYASELEALQAYALSKPSSWTPAGDNGFFWHYLFAIPDFGGALMRAQTFCYLDANGAEICYDQQSTMIDKPAFPSCEFGSAYDSFIDGHTLGWGVVAVMVAAYSVHLLRRALT